MFMKYIYEKVNFGEKSRRQQNVKTYSLSYFIHDATHANLQLIIPLIEIFILMLELRILELPARKGTKGLYCPLTLTPDCCLFQ